MTAVYEICGPDRNFVIKQLTTKYSKIYEESEEIQIKQIIEKAIPENYSDFGSWRGWSTFGLKKEIKKMIEQALKELET